MWFKKPLTECSNSRGGMAEMYQASASSDIFVQEGEELPFEFNIYCESDGENQVLVEGFSDEGDGTLPAPLGKMRLYPGWITLNEILGESAKGHEIMISSGRDRQGNTGICLSSERAFDIRLYDDEDDGRSQAVKRYLLRKNEKYRLLYRIDSKNKKIIIETGGVFEDECRSEDNQDDE